MTEPIDALPLELLQQRGSTKWATHPKDVLPLFVAESDFPLAPAVTDVLRRAVDLGDTGYTPPPARHGLLPVFASFAERRMGWHVDEHRLRTATDVMTGVVEILRAVIAPGDRVVITTPVYPPFFDSVPEAGGVVEEVPLLDTGERWVLDVNAIELALRAGARAVLLANPHNPTGTVFGRDELAAVARVARAHGAVVISDEIHAPLTHPGATFTPFLSASADAAAIGYTVTSPSKAYNLAGLKCALMVTADDATTAVVDSLPMEVEWRTGYFGMLASRAALTPESDAWLDAVRLRLDLNRRLVSDLVDEMLPGARYRLPEAGYLAWIDVSELGWGEDPAPLLLERARVAVNPGPSFGRQGSGHIRLNFATSPEIIREAFARIAALLPR